MPHQTDKQRQKEWEAEDDLRTLRQAEDIKKDSSRLKAANAMAEKELKALGKIKSLITTKGNPKRK